MYLIDDTSGAVLNDSDLSLTLENLIRLCQNRQATDELLSLIDRLRMKHDMLSSTSAAERLSTGTGVNTLAATSLVSSLARGVNNLQGPNHFHSGVTQARDFKDPLNLQEKTDALLRQWIQMYHATNAGQGSATAFQHFVKEMDLHGILKTDEVITR